MMYGWNWAGGGMPWSGYGWNWLLILLVVWDLYWRGKALWAAAKRDHTYWFIALLLVNSVGILPIVYLQFFHKKTKGKK